MAGLIFGVAASAEAGIFAKVFGAGKTANPQPLSSQTVPLLAAALNPDPNPAKGGGDTTIVSGALLSDSGPLGTIANVASTESRSSDQISVYVVREGDTLSQIATMFNVSINTIIWANDLPKNGTVRPGQVLTILPITGISYTVAKGDTIGTIAKKHKGDAEEIALFNGLAVNSPLAIGQKIIIPDGEATPVVAPSRSSSGSSSGGSAGGESQPSYDGYYLRPLVGGKKSQGLHGYNGVDLAAPAGTEILAAANGTVIISKSGGYNGGYGNYVVIRHGNGTQTLYAHNTSNLVSVGEQVSQGQVIATVGSTGRSTGNHVHFEVRGAKNPF